MKGTKANCNGKKPHWKKREQTKVLVRVINDYFGGIAPQSRKDIKQLSDLMLHKGNETSWDLLTIRPNVKKVENDELLI